MRLWYMVRSMLRRMRMAWRVARFRRHGARIGQRVWIGSRVVTDWPFARYLEVQDDVTLGDGTNLILHDATLTVVTGDVPARFGKVTIGRGTCLGHQVTVMPGVTVGEYSLVGACSLVTKNIPPRSFAYGVPARVAGTIEELRERYLERMEAETKESDGRFAYWHVPAWHEHRVEWSTVRASREQFLRENDPRQRAGLEEQGNE
ncbi:MAG: acyltransferase [Anaerolineae bacterium]|nr:acyltransferase [Anaerolineae bacterium]